MKNSRIVLAAALAGAFAGVSSVWAAPTLISLGNLGVPSGELAADAAGNLYGATGFVPGTLFKFSLSTQALTTYSTFVPNGVTPTPLGPVGSLFADSGGNFYGTTVDSGEFSNSYFSPGTLYKVAAGSTTPTLLATLNGTTDGNRPEPGLVADAAGNLYGTSFDGGTGASNSGSGSISGGGTVFKFTVATGTISTVANFNGSSGTQPNGDIIKDAVGNLYETTQFGGVGGKGTVVKIAPATGTITTLAAFNGSNGASPKSGLLEDALGNLYGTTSLGGASNDGTVFEIPASTGLLTTLAAFNGSDGANPTAGLIMDAAGNLFGTTSNGGGGFGTVFEIVEGASTPSVLANFNFTNGEQPDDTLLADKAGNLYGLTLGGGVGSSADGTLFELTGSGFAVPEPTSLSLLAIAALACLGRPRVRHAQPTACE